MEFPEHFYTMLLMLNNVIAQEKDPSNLFRSVALALQPFIHFDRLSLSIYEPQTQRLSWLCRAEGISITTMDDVDSPVRGPLVEEAIRRQETYLVTDLKTLADNDVIKEMLRVGLKWSVALPLINRSQALGGLCISFARPYVEDEKIYIAFLEKISFQIALAVDNMLIHSGVQQANDRLQHQVSELMDPDKMRYAEPHFYYQCDIMQKLMEQVAIIARSDLPVLICGEPGTGKEFIARFIHEYSHRRDKNFAKVSCPGLSGALFESEMFGHVKGSFNGAATHRMGRFELADGGSIFLDEIGELDKVLQEKLLQVLKDSCFERVGESKSTKVNVRIISATNADLEAMIRSKTFSEDLYYRLASFIIKLPPLRVRHGELEGLLRHIVKMQSHGIERELYFRPDAWEYMQRYSWPGNVRELANVVKRLLIVTPPDSEVELNTLIPLLRSSAVQTPMPQASIVPKSQSEMLHPLAAEHQLPQDLSFAANEKQIIERVLTMSNGIVSGSKGAAAILKMPRSTLLYKMRKYGIVPGNYSIRKS